MTGNDQAFGHCGKKHRVDEVHAGMTYMTGTEIQTQSGGQRNRIHARPAWPSKLMQRACIEVHDDDRE